MYFKPIEPHIVRKTIHKNCIENCYRWVFIFSFTPFYKQKAAKIIPTNVIPSYCVITQNAAKRKKKKGGKKEKVDENFVFEMFLSRKKKGARRLNKRKILSCLFF